MGILAGPGGNNNPQTGQQNINQNNLAANQSASRDAAANSRNFSNNRQANSNLANAQLGPNQFKKLETGGRWGVFTGFYGLFNYFGMLSDYLENVVNAGLRHIINTDSLTAKHKKEELPEHLQRSIDVAYSKPSFFVTLLKPVAELLGFEKSKGPDGKEHPGFDGLLTFYSRFLQRFTKLFFKSLGLEVPFNRASDTDPENPGSPFDFLCHQDISKGEDGLAKDPKGHIKAWTRAYNPDPGINAKRIEEIDDIGIFGKMKNLWLMLNHPTVSRAALSFNFGMRNIVENIFTAIPPKNAGVLGAILSVPKLISTTIGTIFQPISSMSQWIFAISGKSNLIDLSALMGVIGSMYVMTGHALENVITFLDAVGTSRKEGTSLLAELKKRDMNWTKVFHAIFGGITAVPSIPGFIARQLQAYAGARYFFVPAARELFSTLHQFFTRYGFAKKESKDKWSNTGASAITGIAKFLKTKAVPRIDAIANSSVIQPILKTIFPVVKDPETGLERIPFEVYDHLLNDVLNTETEGYQEKQAEEHPEIYKTFVGAPTVDPLAKDLKKEYEDKDNLFMGVLNKSALMMYVYKFLVPFQAWSVVVSYSWSGWADKGIQKYGSLPLRALDKFTSFINNMLAFPNNVIYYGLNARGPQTLAAYYDLKQRIADAKGWTTKEEVKDKEGKPVLDKDNKPVVVERPYDVMRDTVVGHRDYLLKHWFPMFRYIGKIIDTDIINNVYDRHDVEKSPFAGVTADTSKEQIQEMIKTRRKNVFEDQHTATKLNGTEFYEWLSFDQEYSTEVPVAVQYLQKAMRFLINNFSFFRRDSKLVPV